jgi:hypothetical protein
MYVYIYIHTFFLLRPAICTDYAFAVFNCWTMVCWFSSPQQLAELYDITRGAELQRKAHDLDRARAAPRPLYTLHQLPDAAGGRRMCHDALAI